MKVVLTVTCALLAVATAAYSRKLQDFTPIVGFSPLTDVRDQVRILVASTSLSLGWWMPLILFLCISLAFP